MNQYIKIKRRTPEQHGRAGTAEYKIWVAVKQRCLNPKSTHYEDYGGRGIEICEAWRDSFATFYADMGSRPSRRHSINRKDPNGNYEPGNCEWATQFKQHIDMRRRIDNKSGYRGIMFDKERNRFRVYINLRGKQFQLGRYKTLKAAVRARKAGEIKYFGLQIL